MKPIAQLEAAALQAWKCKLPAGERAKRLLNVCAAVDHYIARSEPLVEKVEDPFSASFAQRTVTYLRAMRNDLAMMANKLEQTASV